MKRQLDAELAQMGHSLIQMGAACEEAIALVAKALDGERDLLARVEALEEETDHFNRAIEGQCMTILLRRQPVAGDLRRISATLRMITDLERIGDQAADIAEIIASMEQRPWMETTRIREMAQGAIQMVTGSVDAFVREDIDLAHWVERYDDQMDEAFAAVKQDLTALIAQEPAEGAYALDLLMIAKYLERIGDHGVNLAQWVIYALTGEHSEVVP